MQTGRGDLERPAADVGTLLAKGVSSAAAAEHHELGCPQEEKSGALTHDDAAGGGDKRAAGGAKGRRGRHKAKGKQVQLDPDEPPFIEELAAVTTGITNIQVASSCASRKYGFAALASDEGESPGVADEQ